MLQLPGLEAHGQELPKSRKEAGRHHAGGERTRHERTRVALDARSSSLLRRIPGEEKGEFPSRYGLRTISNT